MAETSNTLLVKHLPSSLSDEDQKEMLQHFKATHVRCMSGKGRLKNCAFATFPDHDIACNALKQLHQLELLGSHLCVEFTKECHKDYFPSELEKEKCIQHKDIALKNQEQIQKDKKLREQQNKLDVMKRINSISDVWNLEYPLNTRLKYLYPPPTAEVVTNIVHTLVSVPKFYVQCLHLMNKMNLPAPFGPVTAAPPLAESAPPLPSEANELHCKDPERKESSTDESELESEEEESRFSAIVGEKRHRDIKSKQRKRIKLPMSQTYVPPVQATTSTTHKPADVFEEQPQQTSNAKKISINFPASIPVETDGDKLNRELIETEQKTSGITPDANISSVNVEQGGFGKIEPEKPDVVQTNEEPEEEWGATTFISSRMLRRKRLTESELKSYNVFKNYQSGDATSRLYVKNLSKQVDEKDLHYIFGKYINWEDETEKLMFDIRLMKEGRMKGQAFVTFPSERQAKDALDDTNAFMLHGKPMVVQFARSAKPKAD